MTILIFLGLSEGGILDENQRSFCDPDCCDKLIITSHSPDLDIPHMLGEYSHVECVGCGGLNIRTYLHTEYSFYISAFYNYNYYEWFVSNATCGGAPLVLRNYREQGMCPTQAQETWTQYGGHRGGSLFPSIFSTQSVLHLSMCIVWEI